MGVQTLVRDTEPAPQSPAPEPPDAAAEHPVPRRQCDRCGSAMALGQDWCLECGTAAPGRLGGRPGWRAAVTVVGLTLVLAGGAVAASYAALSSDAQKEASKAPPPAAAPIVASTPAPPAPAPTTTAAAPPPPPSTPSPAPSTSAPKVPAPKVPAAPSPTPTPSHSKGSTGTGTTGTGTGTTDTGTATTPSGPVAVELGPDAASIYDPYNRITDSGDPADSYDQSADTTFSFSTAPGPPEMGVGLDYNLDTAKTVKQIEVTTDTPGFTIEVYGSPTGRPRDILDNRWQHVVSKKDVGKDGKDKATTIKLPSDAGKFRHILLWITAPPQAGPTVGLTEVAFKR
jgi:hypothetical protein